MAYLLEPCPPCLTVKLKPLLSHRKHPDPAHLAAGKMKLTHLLPESGWNQEIFATSFYFTSSPLFSVKETSIQSLARWFSGTLVCHLLGLSALRIKLLSLVSQFIGLLWGKKYELGLSNNFFIPPPTLISVMLAINHIIMAVCICKY